MDRQLHIRTVGRRELGDCPAAVVEDPHTRRAAILANHDALRQLPTQQQRFILAHELGHLILDTDNEQLADAFALGLTAGRQNRSLKHALRAVASMHVVPYHRLNALYDLCLLVDRRRKQNH